MGFSDLPGAPPPRPTIRRPRTPRGYSIQALLDAGALKECAIHPGSYFDGTGDIEKADECAIKALADIKDRTVIPTPVEFLKLLRTSYVELSKYKQCEKCTPVEQRGRAASKTEIKNQPAKPNTTIQPSGTTSKKKFKLFDWQEARRDGISGAGACVIYVAFLVITTGTPDLPDFWWIPVLILTIIIRTAWEKASPRARRV